MFFSCDDRGARPDATGRDDRRVRGIPAGGIGLGTHGAALPQQGLNCIIGPSPEKARFADSIVLPIVTLRILRLLT